MNILNAFQYFTVAGFINALVLSFLLLANHKNHLAKLFMIGLVLIVTFQAILNAFDTRDFFLSYPHLSKISWLIPSLFGPLVYLFTVKLCSHPPAFKQTDLLHFIPFAIYLVVLLPWFLQSAQTKRSYLADFELASLSDFGFMNQFSLLLILAYLVSTLLFLKRFRKEVEATFSEISQKRVQWMRAFAYAVLIVLVVSTLGFYGHKWNIPILDAFYHYNYFPMVLLVYWIAYKSLLQPVIFDIPQSEDNIQSYPFVFEVSESSSHEVVETETRKYTRSGLDDQQAELLYTRLVDFMKKEKPYLDPEINIYQLAKLLNVKKHHLSQVINEKAGINFFDFINEFRVEETKRNLVGGGKQALTLLGVALESGFNSKATFNTAFKKFTGQTPSDFQKSLKNKV